MTKKELKEILESGRFTMLYFYSPECGHCKQISPKVKLFESKYKNNFYQINTFEHEEITNLLEVDWVPVLLITKGGKGKRYDGIDEIKKFLS